MSLLSLINANQESDLVDALSKAILEAIQEGRNEPNIVAHLTYWIPTYVNKLKLNIDGFNLTAGGVFVHQTPKVTFNRIKMKDGQKSIEIGDLLIISTLIDEKDTTKKTITRKAILYQAKIFEKLPVTPDNKNQHTLYKIWPTFTYVNSTPELNGQVRNINGLDLHSSAKYLLLKKLSHQSNNSSFCNISNNIALTAHPTTPLSNHVSFLNEAYNFVLGDAGKDFVVFGNSPRYKRWIGWSRVVNDLLSITAHKATSYMGHVTGEKKASRGCLAFGSQLSFLTEYTQDFSNMVPTDNNSPPTDIPPRSENDNEEGGGISVIEFVLRREAPQETRKS